MIKDLKLSDSADAVCDAQVCVIGAGTAGIFLARQLRRFGLQVVLLEAGDALVRPPEELDQFCEQRGVRYRGAEAGRGFGLGGTSALWGGQMLPLAKSDFEARPEAGFGAWPVEYEEIASYLPIVRDQLGLSGESDSDGASAAKLSDRKFAELSRLSEDLTLRLSEWLPFKNRNFAKCFADTLTNDDGVTVWLNAAVTSITCSPSSTNPRISAIAAQSPNGRKLIVRPARIVVICAGALESTRILLAFDEDTDGSITRGGAPLGRYFADHLSVTCGTLRPRDWQRYNLSVAPIFDRGVMRTPRLELNAAAQRRLGATSAFAHFTFATHGDTGFDVVRSVLRRRQGEQTRLNVSPAILGRVVSDVSAMVFWRTAYRRLWIPRQSDLFLQVDIEQTANADSRLYLSNIRDQMNRKRLVIDWKIRQEDLDVIRKVTSLVAAAWQRSALRNAADLQVTLPGSINSFESLYDVYHPTGSIRMGREAAVSVVDKNLRLWAAENCYVSTTAVFPSAGSANPGLTHLALIARLASHIAAKSG